MHVFNEFAGNGQLFRATAMHPLSCLLLQRYSSTIYNIMLEMPPCPPIINNYVGLFGVAPVQHVVYKNNNNNILYHSLDTIQLVKVYVSYIGHSWLVIHLQK